MATCDSICSLRPGFRTQKHGSPTSNRWRESIQTKSLPYTGKSAGCSNDGNHIGSFFGTRLVGQGTCKLVSTRKGWFHPTFLALAKPAPASACKLQQRPESHLAWGKHASQKEGTSKLLGERHSIAPGGSISCLAKGVVVAGLVLSSSGDVALAELSQAAEQQHAELIRNIEFNATSLQEVAKSSAPLSQLSSASLAAPDISPTASSKETASSGGQGSYNEMVYGRLSELHNDEEAHRAMFTDDAWEGMNIVREYGRLIETKEEEEDACPECLQNRKLVERAWQVVSNEFYDPVRGFSQVRGSEIGCA